MPRTILQTVIIGVTLSLSLPALAEGIYVEGRGGVSFGSKARILFDSGARPFSAAQPFPSPLLEIEFKARGVVEFLIGYHFHNGSVLSWTWATALLKSGMLLSSMLVGVRSSLVWLRF